MRAAIVTPGKAKSMHVADVPAPVRQPNECLVRVLQVGICGTDRDIDAGRYGEAPPGSDFLIDGHESLGEVVESGDSGFGTGDLVVATVRRPCPKRCIACRTGRVDFCRSGHYEERGIKRHHGYLAEFYAESPRYLVPIPTSLRPVGVLLEPMSVVQKALRQIYAMQRRMPWEPKRMLITGAGSIGTLAACVARLKGLEVVIYSRGPSRGADHVIREKIGAQYVSSDDHKLSEIGRFDIAMDATGFSPLAWGAADVLDINGILCMLSVTGGKKHIDIAADALNDQFVLGNRTLFGSVNAAREDFESGVRDLLELEQRWTGVMAHFITRRLPLDKIRTALDERPPDDLKTIIELV
ncbi:MAG TPA: glucose 1-dehydrogenase [Gemmatimonadales bacterium]|nr:glucose 1-dehydrogenase [Gemmatimonadales bacterium]